MYVAHDAKQKQKVYFENWINIFKFQIKNRHESCQREMRQDAVWCPTIEWKFGWTMLMIRMKRCWLAKIINSRCMAQTLCTERAFIAQKNSPETLWRIMWRLIQSMKCPFHVYRRRWPCVWRVNLNYSKKMPKQRKFPGCAISVKKWNVPVNMIGKGRQAWMNWLNFDGKDYILR